MPRSPDGHRHCRTPDAVNTDLVITDLVITDIETAGPMIFWSMPKEADLGSACMGERAVVLAGRRSRIH